MKKIALIIPFILLMLSSNHLKAQGDAAAMISYLTGIDAEKITRTAVMIKQIGEGIKVAKATKGTAESITATLKQMKEDGQKIGNLEQMVAEQLDERIGHLRGMDGNELLDQIDVPYVDFYDAYMESTSKFRTGSGDLDLIAIGGASLMGEGIGDQMLQNVAGQSRASVDDMYDFYKGAISNRKVLRAIHAKEISQLNKLARKKELHATYIHLNISVLQVKGSYHAVGGLAELMKNENQMGGGAEDKMIRTRNEIQKRLTQANTLLDEARELRRKVRSLMTKPLPMNLAERQYLDKLTAVATDVQYTAANALLLTDIKGVKIRTANASHDDSDSYMAKAIGSSSRGGTISGPNSKLNSAVWGFFAAIKPVLDAIVGLIIVLGMFKVTAKFVSGEAATGMMITVIAGFILWFLIVPEIVNGLAGKALF